MNTLMQTAVSTWETHNKNNVASALIVDGLVANMQDNRKKVSSDTVEMTSVENRLNTVNTVDTTDTTDTTDTANAENVVSTFFECLAGTMKASA